MAATFAEGPPGALSGMRVVELAGPLGEWCGRLLAGMGADVIKVEPPEGAATRAIGPFAGDEPVPERSLWFWHYNAGKQSVMLDIDLHEGHDLLRRLIASADVFLETLRPGEAAALGLAYAALRQDNPRLIHCAITPFGQDGPRAAWHTTDLVSMALGGPMQSCGYDPEDELPPVRPGAGHSYHTAGHFAMTGILAALIEREGSGQGQYLDVAAHDCLSVTVEFANTHWYYARNIVRRQTGRHASPMITTRNQYPTADGRYVNLSLPRDNRAWLALVAMLNEKGLGEGLDDPALLDPMQRFAAGSRAYDLLEVLCATHTADELFHLGQGLGMTWGAVRPPEAWLDDPHAAARGFFQPLEHPEMGATYRYPGAPFVSPASPFRLRRRAPLPGEDTAAVLAALGVSEQEQAALRAHGATG